MAEFINKYLEQYFDELEPLEFYRKIFPKGELETRGTVNGEYERGKYHAIAVELLPKAAEDKKNVRRYVVYDDLKEIEQLLESDNFIIISPISYIGTSRKSSNARYIYAMAIDLDGITKERNLADLFLQIDEREHLPKPTYVVSSGSGLHLYFQFEKPIPCFENIVKQLQRLKKDLTRKIWNGYVTELEDKVQYESLFQGFRMCGGVTKSGDRTRVFEYGGKVSIEYLNEFVIDKKNQVIDYTYKSNLTLSQAKEKYPEWYEKRVVLKQPKGTWTTKPDLFYWWVDKLKSGATVGHRYYCCLALAVYAKKSGIDREELEQVAFDLIDYLESLTTEEENHFTRADILAALEMYNDNYIRFPIDSITKLTQIPIEKNKRNGRKREEHLKRARAVQAVDYPNGEWRNKNGKGITKDKIVREWRRLNPVGTKADCIRETKLSKPTVYKYWD